MRLHGLIERVPRTCRYRVDDVGLREALFLTRACARLLRPGLAELTPAIGPPGSRLRRQFDAVAAAIDRQLQEVNLAA